MTAFNDVSAIGDWLRQGLYGLGLRGVVLDGVLAFVVVFLAANFALANGGLMTWAFRREIAFVTDRYGPNRVGPQGLLQFLADGIKMILKEAMIPRKVDRILFIVTPVIAVFPFVMVYLVIPFSRGGAVADVNVGLLYLFAITSLTFPSLFMAGWSSNNKYAMMGGMRAIAQLLAFEVPLTLSVVGIILLTGTLSLNRIVELQPDILHWFLWPQIIGAVVFVIAALAENAIHPFDLPEAESELVVGYFVEYSGIMFGLFTLAEIGTTWTLAAVFTTLFLGGWQTPIPGHVLDFPLLWFLVKTYSMFFLLILIRASLPRFRIDHFLSFGWKFLTPAAFANLVAAALEALAVGSYYA